MLEGRTSGNINLSDIQRGKRKIWQENIEETLVGKNHTEGENTNLVICNWKVSNIKSEMFHYI